jgi:hypothetical protein
MSGVQGSRAMQQSQPTCLFVEWEHACDIPDRAMLQLFYALHSGVMIHARVSTHEVWC